MALSRVVERLRCQTLDRNGHVCGGRPDLVTLDQGRQRRKDFQVFRKIVVRNDRLRISDQYLGT